MHLGFGFFFLFFFFLGWPSVLILSCFGFWVFFGLALSFDSELFWFLGFAYFLLGWLQILIFSCFWCLGFFFFFFGWVVKSNGLLSLNCFVVIFNGLCLYSSVCACGHWVCPLRFLKYAENHENNRV